MKKMLYSIVTIGTVLAVSRPATAQDMLFFGNGVSTIEERAKDQLRLLQKAYADYLGITEEQLQQTVETQLAYNTTLCATSEDPEGSAFCIDDWYEALTQAANDSGLGFGSPGVSTGVWLFLLTGSGTPVALWNVFLSSAILTAKTFDESVITQRDLEEHLALYRDVIEKGRKVVLVAHSQGNFFANDSYELLPIPYRQAFGIVSVATPASHVAGNGSHRTSVSDFIWSIPGALSPNTLSGPSCIPGWGCHAFSEYLDGPVSGPQIMAHIDETLARLEMVPPPVITRVLSQGAPGEPGKDIWTTNVFSYATGSVGPGGGLDDDRLRVGGWGDFYHSLIDFDLSGLPHHVQSARIELFPRPHEGATGQTALYLDRITESWEWRTQGTGSDRERLWWADRPDAVQWRADALPAPTPGQWYSIDITDLYNLWQAGVYPTYGVQLRPVSIENTWSEFYSANSADQTMRPRLVIEPSSQSQMHPMIGVWRGTVAWYAAEMTIEQSGDIFSARLSMDQAREPVEQLDVRTVTETTFVAYRPADHNAELRLVFTQAGTQSCLVGDYIENGGYRPISLCKAP